MFKLDLRQRNLYRSDLPYPSHPLLLCMYNIHRSPSSLSVTICLRLNVSPLYSFWSFVECTTSLSTWILGPSTKRSLQTSCPNYDKEISVLLVNDPTRSCVLSSPRPTTREARGESSFPKLSPSSGSILLKARQSLRRKNDK